MISMISAWVMYFPVHTKTSLLSSMTKSFRAICVDASALVCACRDRPCMVCVSVVNLVFHTLGFVGIVWFDAWWYTVPSRRSRNPPRYLGWAHPLASIRTVTVRDGSPFRRPFT